MLNFHRCIHFCDHYHNQDTESSYQPEKFSLPCCCSVAKLYLTLCDPMSCSIPGFRVLHYLLEFAQTHVHWISDAIQPSHPLLSPSPPTFNLSQHQGFFQWVNSLHQMAKNWSFSFGISASKEYLGLISFRIDWYDVLEVQGTLKSLLQYHSSKASILWRSALSPTLTSINVYWKNQGFDKTELCWQINVSAFKYAV